MKAIGNLSIFITGAGGSIGSLLSLRIARLRPQQLTLLDSSEHALYRLRMFLEAENLCDRVTLLLGSVGDELLLEETIQSTSPDIIFHAAAHKHLPLLEEYALAAIRNNTLATNTLLRVAAEHKIRRTILLSTDKAASPTSVLGVTKHIAEIDTLCHGGIVVRLVNVLGSEGSVVPAFLRQMAADQAIAITHPGATRYFVTDEEAVDLLLTASVEAPDATTLVPAVYESQSIVELAHFLRRQCTPSSSSTIRYIGLSAGEKQNESLWSRDEDALAESFHDCLRVIVRRRPMDGAGEMDGMLALLRMAVDTRNLPQAMNQIQSLVPDYAPSRTVLQKVREHLEAR